MVYEKPKLIDLSEHPETGHGQMMECKSGSGARGPCVTGSGPGVDICAGGQGGFRP